MLIGRSPYGALKDEALAEAVRYGTIKAPSAIDPEVPERLEAIAMRALARDPGERFASAREMAGAIGRALLDEQQLVDNTSVEEAMNEILGRDAESGALEPEPQRTLAAVRKPRTSASEASILGTDHQYPDKRIVREVRHVTVTKLRLEGIDA